MKIHIKNLEGCARLLEIKAEPKEVETAQEEVLHDFERLAKVPGYRQGKAPRDLVERYYGETARKEFLKRFIPDLYGRALEEVRLRAVGYPEISDVLFEKSQLSFKAKIEIKPEVSVRKYKGLKAAKKSATATPQEIQESLRALQEERAELSLKEGVVEEDNFVVCDFEGKTDGKVTDDRKNVLLSASLKNQKHLEVTKALLGAKAGETREAEVTVETPGGVVQKTHYTFRINEVKKRVLPELNDDFSKMAGSFQTLKELEEALAREIARQKEEKAQKEVEAGLLAQLSKDCSFDLPRLLIDEEAKHLADEERFHFRLLGIKDGDLEARIGQNQEKRLEEAARRVKNSLILEKIAEMEKLSASLEEIEARIRVIGERLDRSQEEKTKDLANEALRQRIAGEIILEKAVQVIVSHAQIQEVVNEK